MIPQGFDLRSGSHVPTGNFEQIEQLADGLLRTTLARMVLVIDVSGQVVTARGKYDGVDLVVLGSLVAGDLAASQEIARLTGAYQDYQLVTREGIDSHSFIAEAGQNFVLFIQMGTDTPLGWARVQIRHAAEHLAKIEVQKNQGIPGMIAAELAQEDGTTDLSDLFGEALDDLWSD